MQWANEYLNETVSGLQLGTALLRRRFEDPGLSVRERAFLGFLRPAFIDLVNAEQRLYVGGAADLLGEVRSEELDAYRNLFELVEKRAALLDVIGESTLEPRSRSCASATSSSTPRSRRSRSSAPATDSCTAHSAR